MVLKKKMNLITNKELLNQKSEDPFMFGVDIRKTWKVVNTVPVVKKP
jgi:hypothetical protein